MADETINMTDTLKAAFRLQDEAPNIERFLILAFRRDGTSFEIEGKPLSQDAQAAKDEICEIEEKLRTVFNTLAEEHRQATCLAWTKPDETPGVIIAVPKPHLDTTFCLDDWRAKAEELAGVINTLPNEERARFASAWDALQASRSPQDAPEGQR